MLLIAHNNIILSVVDRSLNNYFLNLSMDSESQLNYSDEKMLYTKLFSYEMILSIYLLFYFLRRQISFFLHIYLIIRVCNLLFIHI